MEVVQAERLSKRYRKGDEPAVTSLDFEIHAGEVFSILGHNGAGKTTTVKMLLGLVLPSGGVARIKGFDMARHRGKGAAHAGAVLEGARNVYWRLSARENLIYFGSLRGLSGQRLKQRIDDVLELVDLADRQHDEVRRFSRGMQQKLAVAVALLHDPEVLLLDEPTLGLDVQAARTLETTVARLAREQGKAVLLTTHQMPLAEKLSNRVMVMRRGEAVACDRTSTLLGRFSGSSFEIQLADPESGQRALGSLAGLNSAPVLGENGTLVWKHIEQSQAVTALARLDASGIAVERMGRRAATLEEVYLALTGENGAHESSASGGAA